MTLTVEIKYILKYTSIELVYDPASLRKEERLWKIERKGWEVGNAWRELKDRIPNGDCVFRIAFGSPIASSWSLERYVGANRKEVPLEITVLEILLALEGNLRWEVAHIYDQRMTLLKCGRDLLLVALGDFNDSCY